MSALGVGSTAGAVRISLAASHQFNGDSPTNRVYIVQDPIMYCFESGFLYQYSDYGYHAAFASGGTLQNQIVIGHQLTAGSFSYLPAVLTRNAIITMSFNVTSDKGVSQAVSQEVQIRNVP